MLHVCGSRRRLALTCVISDQLRENALLKQFYCDVKINDLINFNEELAHKLASEPAEVIPLVSFSAIFGVVSSVSSDSYG